MKLISWNVNGLRACIKKGFFDIFNKVNADVFCLQEIKMERGQTEINFIDYQEYWNSADKKGYSGVSVFTRIAPLSVFYGMGIDEHDHEGRMVTLEFDMFYLVNVYTPNTKRDLSRLKYRMKWEDDFRKYVCDLNNIKPVIICGDLNCAHTEMDIKNAKQNKNNSGFTKEERNKMTELLSVGFTDFFRYFFPNKNDAYTWWLQMRDLRERNIGWRIDYFLGSERLIDKVMGVGIYSEIYGSDHCPVWLEIED